MRALIFLLVLGNLLFLAWAQGYLGTSASPDAQRMERQLQPERLSIVGRGEAPARAPAAENETEKGAEKGADGESEQNAEKPQATACLRWNGLATADVTRVEQLLAGKFPLFKLMRGPQAAHASYWVFIPPLANKQEADKKAGELKRLSVPEYFIVQDASPQRLAISLGIFSTEAAALERLEALRAKGVRSARVGARNADPARTSLELSGPATQAEALRTALAALLPVAGVACPEPRP